MTYLVRIDRVHQDIKVCVNIPAVDIEHLRNVLKKQCDEH
jgi:hypothetical protein